MAVATLTKRTVDALSAGEKFAITWDKTLKGFGVKVTPKGKKVYLVQFRLSGVGSQKRLTIGKHGTYTVEQARSVAGRALLDASEGKDPRIAKRERKSAPNVARAAEEFLAEAKRKRRPSTYYEYARPFRRDRTRKGTSGVLLAAFGTLQVADVNEDQIEAFHASFSDRPYAGNRLLALLSVFFYWCEKRKYRAKGTNPCIGVERYKEEKRERFLSPAEMQRLGDALRAVDAEKRGAEKRYSGTAVAALRFLTLSGFRESEALSLRWDAIDLDRRVITLQTSKSGKSTRPLSAAALALLADIPRVSGNPFVFPSDKIRGTHVVELRNIWNRVRSLADLKSLRLHDLRHTVASVAASSGASLPLIGAVLGHRDVRSTHRYAHLTDDARAALADRTADEIAALMSVTPSTSEIRLVQSGGRAKRA